MDSRKDTGIILGFIPIPKGTPFHFFIINLMFSAFIEMSVGTYFIVPFISLLICYDMYIKNDLRIKILENCLVDEIFMEEELKEYGVGEFVNDSVSVTDEDRNSIFLDSVWIIGSRNKKSNKIYSLFSFILDRN